MELWQRLDDKYEVSNRGRVRNTKSGRVLRAYRNPEHGYLYVTLYGKKKRMHRLVARAFIGDVTGMHVHHIDGDTANNAANNLDILTPGDHAKLKKYKRLTVEQKCAIIELWNQGLKVYAISQHVGVSSSHVRRLINRARHGAQPS